MKKFLFLLVILTFCYYKQIDAQIVFDAGDMPNVNDTFRLGIANVPNSFNLNQTGDDFLWNFSTLVKTSETVDSFVSVLSTPLSYNAVFNQPWDPNKATIASPQQTQGFTPPGLTITDIYNYYRETPARFVHLGFAAKVNNTPTPIKFDNPELLFTFPLTVGSVDSSKSFWEINIPNYGYMSQKRKRVNYYDGWGTLITPFDTFSVIRIKSVINIHDSMNYNGMGFARDAVETHYRWMADTLGVPALHIIVSGNSKRATFYNPAMASSSVNHFDRESKVYFYPNPVSDFLYITGETTELCNIELYRSDGMLINSWQSSLPFRLSLSEQSAGVYFCKVNSFVRKIVKLQ